MKLIGQDRNQIQSFSLEQSVSADSYVRVVGPDSYRD